MVFDAYISQGPHVGHGGSGASHQEIDSLETILCLYKSPCGP